MIYLIFQDNSQHFHSRFVTIILHKLNIAFSIYLIFNIFFINGSERLDTRSAFSCVGPSLRCRRGWPQKALPCIFCSVMAFFYFKLDFHIVLQILNLSFRVSKYLISSHGSTNPESLLLGFLNI